MTFIWAKLISFRAIHSTRTAGILRTHMTIQRFFGRFCSLFKAPNVRTPVLPTGLRLHNDMIKALGARSEGGIAPEEFFTEVVNTVIKRLHPPPPSHLREPCIGSVAELTEAQSKESLPLTVNFQGRFFYHKIKEEYRPEGWSNLPQDLEQSFRTSPAKYFGLEDPIPILYMRETGYEFLIESSGQIYIWNVVRDDLKKMVKPTTLGELLDLMNDEQFGPAYRHRVWEDPCTKWESIAMKETLPEHDI